MTPGAVYLLPLRRSAVDPDELADLGSYLARIARRMPVVVADGSPPAIRAHHRRHLVGVRHLAVPRRPPGVNGKVQAVLAALRATTEPLVLIADDDVRHDGHSITRLLAELERVDLVAPQNVFATWPWHARWDTARTLVNRAFGVDYPGTLALRRSALGECGYSQRVLFENLELLRTVRARGGTAVHVLDVVVPRRVPTATHFAGQRVRQAYDSLAQPTRLLTELSLAPLAAASVLAARRRRQWLAVPLGMAAGSIALAEVGRRRAGGRRAFPATSALWAPLWLVERALCAWAAVFLRALGGMPYAGGRLRRAAHGQHALEAAYRTSSRSMP